MTSGIRVGSLLRGLALVLIASLCSIRAPAAEPVADTPWGIEPLMHELARVKVVKSRFVERKHLRILSTPLEFSGTLLYAAPAHLEKHTLQPKPQSLILDQNQLIVEDGTKKQRRILQLQDIPLIWALVESIRATLAGDLPALNRFYRVDLEGRENQWRLVLRPTDANLGALLTVIRISGQGRRVRRIEIFEAEGNRSVMTITEEPQ